MNQYLAVTSNGMENLLVEELTKLGIENAKPVQAGVKFKATNEQVYRCCLWSRLASRFVRVLSEFTCNDDMDLYLSTSAINWVNQFHSSKRFVVDFNGTNREIRNSQYGAMKVKDGIVDCFEKKGLPRPNISKERPDIRVHVRLHKDKALLGVDMVGSGLHQRGYRPESGRAPLRETLAAAIIMRCGWDGHQPLLDPMCGSGTLLIEAAMMAANMAPGVKRKQWGFESLEDFEADTWAEIKSEANVQARRGVKKVDAKFFGFDNDPKVLKVAQDNARRAGVEELIEFAQGDAATITRPTGFENGVIVSNPPYGERLGTEPGLIALYTAFGGQLKSEFGGCKASIFSSSDELLSCLRMRADKQFKLNNGALPCHQKNYSISERSAEEVKGADTNVQIAPDFSNRLKKNIGKIGKWARKEELDCYRIYDADLPEYNVAIDMYGDQIVIQEYAAPKNIPEEKAKRRLTDIIRATIQVTGVEANKVVLKVREKQKGRSQYQKLGQVSETLEVNEYGVKLIVNLHDYLDTGLFLDHKITRRRLGEMAKGKDFLNLFAYTGSATVHAAVGGARSTTTVDMSNTYLNWAKDNMQLNGCVGRQHRYEQADCLQWLENAKGEYDLIFIDPPTFSNSKRMDTSFDVQRDHIKLMKNLKRLLRSEGTIVFSNNKRHFKMDEEALAELGLKAQNISSQTLPLDFSRNKQIHNCWLVTHAE
ncbi:bifunctional 23S rRNA (guanine(2069)-N(7))-methyltransferase RlmK/23S rRNA (guanine(2445)-N(2))-methyltransferase RlmL [Vibrio alginolyticus]|uniref:bifunctional 23S rRNA (guanine(2069)-N(7))-methyltransferase RlmK/23S rRNA (guanine(2445)-N(2))-methyltransferase RlmL n=1 Tax=Vibrio sp. B1FLJ16 TaxID=2751178 RepID=UPI0015F472E2|nr:bifunctional 23S rRNA (guanine(2069)-N(7))-methyltransferase RlmK/23S rRNA (guanine(2445)-N(2))-methyltransferase RlmL [Vibrio sp. B1FLJ16]CAD7805647.1 Specifically methylates the guanine in position 2445 (m2G2445) and the guanine in position 2069 (m7G2069) of 23S rRNA [Vibrio sp. B1FLJ16]CAD7805816.1 Specifically methylates the guanine in position 2445 (m2G2445) and the guanine in position 2069 (m7G2069) of 23S rRNA [Vibrio sp. B1FLJ16]CAE6900256.1 Specifically methylates the guanine in posi